MLSVEQQLEQGKKSLANFKEIFSSYVYAALEQPAALMMIANKQINLQSVQEENSCYTFSYLFNEQGYECLNKKFITFENFLAIPKHERYTLQYLFQNGLTFLEKGIIDLKKFLSIPEKKRLGYIDNLKAT